MRRKQTNEQTGSLRRPFHKFAANGEVMAIIKESKSFGIPWEKEYGYSQAVKVGDTIYLSGQVSHDDKGHHRPERHGGTDAPSLGQCREGARTRNNRQHRR